MAVVGQPLRDRKTYCRLFCPPRLHDDCITNAAPDAVEVCLSRPFLLRNCTMKVFHQTTRAPAHRLRRRRSKLLELPWEVLRRIMLFTMDSIDAYDPSSLCDRPRSRDCSQHYREVFLNVSNPVALQNGLRLALTCHIMHSVFQDALTGVKLVSSWQAEQNTLIAACKIAASNLRAVHVECSAPVTAALTEVVSLRPPVRHFVLIGVNISKALMADIIFYVGISLENLVVSAAPSLDDTVVDLISDKCESLRHLELGGSRHVSRMSLIRLFTRIGINLRGIEMNSVRHESLNEDVLFAIGQYCSKLTCIRLRNLPWVSDVGMASFLKQRAQQLKELRIVDCHRASFRSLCVFCKRSTVLEKLHFSVQKGSWIPLQREMEAGYRTSSDEERVVEYTEDDIYFSGGEKALMRLSRKCRQLHHLTISDISISDAALSCISKASGPSLRYLNIRHCYSLGNATLLSWAKHCRSLTSLDISYLPMVEDSAFEELLRALQDSLEELQILGCTGLTNNAIQNIIPRYGRRLQVVRLSYCNFSMSALASLKEALPRVTLFGTSNGAT